ncbi:MAG: cellulase family glycosylhydrolase [Chloroflexota bacterium]
MLITTLALLGGHFLTPRHARAHESVGPVQVGTSFSVRRAEGLGLDWRQTYRDIEDMHFKVIRLSVYWDQVDAQGYDQVDWLMQESVRNGQPVVLTVGMKALGWPEYYIPDQYLPRTGSGGDVSRDLVLGDAVLPFIQQTVERYRDYPNLVAWQVENEPFNPSGPSRWWIGRDLLERELATVRSADRTRHRLIVNVFGHFNMQLDAASSRSGATLGSLLGFDSDSAERDALSVIQPGDILGSDVYTRIGYRFLGRDAVAEADSNWDDRVAEWQATALKQGKQAWVTEAQAEPWEADSSTYATPSSFSPPDVERTFHDLKLAGQSTVLLWGVEYWYWRLQNGDPTWLEAARSILRSEARAPAVG